MDTKLTDEEKSLIHALVQKECDRVIQELDDTTMWENKHHDENVTVVREGGESHDE